jgi:aspartokinase
LYKYYETLGLCGDLEGAKINFHIQGRQPDHFTISLIGDENLMTDEMIAVGGIKVVEGGAFVAISSPSGKDYLRGGICLPLAQQRINITLLTHMTGGGELNSASVICTDIKAGATSYSLAKASYRSIQDVIRLHPGTCIVSIYPYNRRPEIVGNFLRALARAKVLTYAVASSRSSISAVMSLDAKEKAIRQLFKDFYFSSYASAAEFFAAQPPPEELVKQVVAVYQESVIKIYYLEELPDQDIWSLSVPSVMALERFGEALLALKNIECPIPFFLAVWLLGKKELLFSFSTSSHHADEVRRLLKFSLPGINLRRQRQVAAIFLHGPHFGDRYGIASTLLEALDQAKVSLLAISCSVSTISAMVKKKDLESAMEILTRTFEIS